VEGDMKRQMVEEQMIKGQIVENRR
jgi:hypothetical protein